MEVEVKLCDFLIFFQPIISISFPGLVIKFFYPIEQFIIEYVMEIVLVLH